MADDHGIEGLNPAQREQLRVGAALLSNPELRRETQRLYKRANPKAIIPELETEDAIARARAEDEERFKKLEADNMTLRVANRKRERDDQARSEGFEPADIEAIIVREKCSYETAMKFAAMERQTAEPGPGDVRHGNAPGSPLELRPGEEFRKAGGDKRSLARVSANLAADMIDGFRGRRARTR
jgi:hypothetical protein